MTSDRILAWHFLRDDAMLRDGTGPVVAGETYSIPDDTKVVPCKWGMHASINPLDALCYAPGSMICRVEIWGDVQGHGGDKVVGRHRKVLWVADATEVLREFARECARSVIHLWDAPDVVREYLKTGDETLRDAAGNAAWNAAWATTLATAQAAQSTRLTEMLEGLAPKENDNEQ